MWKVLIFPFVLALASAQLLGGLSSLRIPQLPQSISNLAQIPQVPQIAGNLAQLTQLSQIANNIPLLNNVQTFADFLTQTGKTYATAAERALRQRIFRANKVTVDRNNRDFNLGRIRFLLAINAFSDLSTDEFVSKMTGYKKSSVGESRAKQHRTEHPVSKGKLIPDSFDWREKGGVTPVKFQGDNCSSCWSFAVAGALEGHIFRKTGKLVPLSEQNLIDCSSDFGNIGCGGGFQDYGFAYVTQNMGLDAEKEYPYEMKDGKCHYNRKFKAADAKGYAVIKPGNEQKMKEVIATLGPLACSIKVNTETFLLYKSGIFHDEKCNEGELNHTVLVVGYGSEGGMDYWIVKNSWGSSWGDGGYIKIPRNRNSFCGIASECSYPIV